MSHLVIGMGEVGRAIRNILKDSGDVVRCYDTRESDDLDVWHFTDNLHICFPYSEDFIAHVKKYAETSSAGLVIIHSTVPVGTTDGLNDELDNRVVHSPIRGVHPNLEEGIRTFMKFFGGPQARKAADIFLKHDIRVSITSNACNTEAMKLWDTEQYRRFILLNKEIKDYCEKNGLDFDIVYTKANESYNQGYKKLGMEHVIRPNLYWMPGPIGGHCVEPNHKLLYEDPDTQ